MWGAMLTRIDFRDIVKNMFKYEDTEIIAIMYSCLKELVKRGRKVPLQSWG